MKPRWSVVTVSTGGAGWLRVEAFASTGDVWFESRVDATQAASALLKHLGISEKSHARLLAELEAVARVRN